MECSKCLEENAYSLKTKGYGYGYIGKNLFCERHNTNKINNNIPDKINSFAKWTDGQPYERSRRASLQNELEEREFRENSDLFAHSLSLHHDENTWDMLNQTAVNTGFKVSNKREELGDKLSSRAMVQQIGFNPFLSEKSYIDDITVRDQFLKPINTTQGEKNKNSLNE
jgi:hypothetical protein